MDINELESFNLSDAVKFHDKLNPALWTEKGELDVEVKDQLLEIAKDFISELGINSTKVEDITISGSNAAYTYTPHSDLDLHILVDFKKLPNDEVYQELFKAKKTLYNDNHNITVHGVPVELYVQDSNEPVVSLGEYSLLKNEWIKYPKKRRANFDQNATVAKYEKLGELIELALQTQDVKKVNKVLDIVKRYRKAGLDSTGEFGPENLAFKALRKQGLIKQLWDLKNKLHSKDLSIEDYHPNSKPRGPEFPPTMPSGTVRVDVSDVYDWYKLGQHISDLEGLGKHDFGKGPPSTILSFGDEDLEHQYIDALKKTGLNTTDIDPKGHEPKKGQKVDPTYNVNENIDYMAGHCHVMALALKQLHPDWKIRAHIGWEEESEDDEDYRVDHVYIVAPDGSAYDCRGKFSNEQELVGPDETGGVETQFVNYSLANLKADVKRGELKKFTKDDILKALEFVKRMKLNVNEILDKESAAKVYWSKENYMTDAPVSQMYTTYTAAAQDKNKNILKYNFYDFPKHDLTAIEFSRAVGPWGDNFGIDNAGDQYTVFATLVKTIEEYLSDHKPKFISFGAKEPSRAKLYQTFVNRFASKFGYKQISPDNIPKPVQSILFNRGDTPFLLQKVGTETVKESVKFIEGTNCKNCVWWKKDSEKPVGKDELNKYGGLKPPNKEYIAMSKRVDLVTLPGKDTVKEKGFCYHKDINDWVTERMCCAKWDGKGVIRDYKGESPLMEESQVDENIEKVDGGWLHTGVGHRFNWETNSYPVYPLPRYRTYINQSIYDQGNYNDVMQYMQFLLTNYQTKNIEITGQEIADTLAKLGNKNSKQELEKFNKKYNKNWKSWNDFFEAYKEYEEEKFQNAMTRIGSKIGEASGYVPSEKEKNDPRFKTALTVDVKPDSIQKNAKAFGFKVARNGKPPLLRK